MPEEDGIERDWHHRTARLNGVRTHYVETGVPDAGEDRDLVVCLHGFPDCWYTWRHQLDALADAGFHVVAPDTRGYGETAVPEGVAAYDLDGLVDDVEALVAHVGAERAHVVGHDLGGLVAWAVGAREPDWLGRLAILNAPHLDRYERALRSLDQLRRSWYVLYFQLPWLPERGFHRYRRRVFEALLHGETVREDAFSAADVDRYVEAFADRRRVTAAMHYYRALGRRTALQWLAELLPGRSRPDRSVDVPTLLVWGLADDALPPRLTTGLDPWVSDLRVERLPGAGHWVHVDVPDRVNGLLVDFLAD